MPPATNAIQVRELAKSFRTPLPRAPRFGKRVLPPLRQRYVQRPVLEDVSFEVAAGEFFGIVGRNGSGKSTLLKILAGIYPPDRGSSVVRGAVGPFLELGVGFNPELPARDNIKINCVIMGLTPQEVRMRLDRILEFAELGEFADTKLKNFSSGMRVRLAFAAIVETEPDVLLVDEVLAVGDAAFQEKCADTLMRLRRQRRTIVFVTHAMAEVERMCDRAMLLEGGRVAEIGDPGRVTLRYTESNLERRHGVGAELATDEEQRGAAISDGWLTDERGERRASVGPGERIDASFALEVQKTVQRPALRLAVRNERGSTIFGATVADLLEDQEGRLTPRERARVEVSIENPLNPGRYILSCSLIRIGRNGGEIPISAAHSVPFSVSGPRRKGRGFVELEHSAGVVRDVGTRAPA